MNRRCQVTKSEDSFTKLDAKLSIHTFCEWWRVCVQIRFVWGARYQYSVDSVHDFHSTGFHALNISLIHLWILRHTYTAFTAAAHTHKEPNQPYSSIQLKKGIIWWFVFAKDRKRNHSTPSEYNRASLIFPSTPDSVIVNENRVEKEPSDVSNINTCYSHLKHSIKMSL